MSTELTHGQPKPEIFKNPLRDSEFTSSYSESPRWFHRRFPGYDKTPLLDLPELAHRFGVKALLVKDESMRLGLPAFKILGASWASYRALCCALGHEPTDWTNIDELSDAFASLRPLTLATATDGNHGRALARIAKLLRFSARIWVPQNTVTSRISAIESEGAEVIVTNGGYEQAVSEAALAANDRVLVISDTSWSGYEDIPGWVIDGYTTILEEVDEQTSDKRVSNIDMAIVPVGVGAFAAAVAKHYRSASNRSTILVSAEPSDAACCLKSAQAGRILTLENPQVSIMAGLNCGSPSKVAWPIVSKSFDLFATVNDAQAIKAMCVLAENGIAAGESAAAPLAALQLLYDQGHLTNAKDKTILLFLTEGVTDPELYEREVIVRQISWQQK